MHRRIYGRKVRRPEILLGKDALNKFCGTGIEKSAELEQCIEGFTDARLGGRKFFLVEMHWISSAELE